MPLATDFLTFLNGLRVFPERRISLVPLGAARERPRGMSKKVKKPVATGTFRDSGRPPGADQEIHTSGSKVLRNDRFYSVAASFLEIDRVLKHQ